jgi:hypothetical protein
MSLPHRKHVTAPLRTQQFNAIYRFLTMVCWYNYQNSGHYSSSCLLFWTGRFGDWILSPSSGGTYSVEPKYRASPYLRRLRRSTSTGYNWDTETNFCIYCTVELWYICHLITVNNAGDRTAWSFWPIFYRALFSSVISQFRCELHKIAARHSFHNSRIREDCRQYKSKTSLIQHIHQNSVYPCDFDIYRRLYWNLFQSFYIYLYHIKLSSWKIIMVSSKQKSIRIRSVQLTIPLLWIRLNQTVVSVK